MNAPAARIVLNRLFHSLLQQRQDGGLLRRQARNTPAQLGFRAVLERLEQRAIHVSIDNRGVDVALAADRLRFPNRCATCSMALVTLRLAAAFVSKSSNSLSASAASSPGPRSKILGSEIVTTRFPQIIVDVRRSNVVHIALFVDVLE